MKNFSVWVFDTLFKSFVSSNLDEYETFAEARQAAQKIIDARYYKRVKICEYCPDGGSLTLLSLTWRNRSKNI